MSSGAASASYFQVLDETPERGRYAAMESTTGPWSAGLQHGGPPSALLVRAAERAAAAATGRDDLVALRCAAEFAGPVPVAVLDASTQVVRAGRSAVLVRAALAAGDREVLHARIWLVRHADTSAISSADQPVTELPPERRVDGWNFPYARTIDWRPASGRLFPPGPATVQARPRTALVPGVPLEAMTGLQRVMLVGDSSSGISAELDWDAWSFANIDLDVHLLRPVSGPWVQLAAATTLGDGGAALARATVSDRRGVVGATAQTLVLTPLGR